MTRPVLGGVLLLVTLAGGVARASEMAGVSEQSFLSVSEGLVQFHQDHFQEALASFDAAVKVNPEDMIALYYRGVTLARLDQTDQAIADLRTVVAARPDLTQASLELGIALFRAAEEDPSGAAAERYREASQWLEHATSAPDLAPQANLFLGLDQFRQADYDAAVRSLQQPAESTDPRLRLPARYYLGLIDYREGRFSNAEEQFSDVVATSPNSDMGREAAKFLDLMGAGQPYQVYGAIGLEYDSNVVLAPSSGAEQTALGITNQADGRTVVSFGGRYIPWRTEHAQLSLGYEFYQSIYFQLTDFDLQDHRPSVELVGRTDFAEFGFLGQYDFDLLGASSLMQQVTTIPWVRIPEAGFGYTELFFRMWRQDYLQEQFQDRLDAFNFAGGIRQFMYLGSPERYVWAGYRYDNNDPVHSEVYAYNGNQASVGAAWTFEPIGVDSELAYWYHHEAYGAQSGGRRDNQYYLTFLALKPLTDHLLLRGAFFGTINDSNVATYEYNRAIVSLGLEVRF